jgi:hypothetical protein
MFIHHLSVGRKTTLNIDVAVRAPEESLPAVPFDEVVAIWAKRSGVARVYWEIRGRWVGRVDVVAHLVCFDGWFGFWWL